MKEILLGNVNRPYGYCFVSKRKKIMSMLSQYCSTSEKNELIVLMFKEGTRYFRHNFLLQIFGLAWPGLAWPPSELKGTKTLLETSQGHILLAVQGRVL